MKKIGLSFKFKGFALTVGGYMDEAGAVAILHVQLDEGPQRMAQMLSLKPERGSLLTDIEWEARVAWAKR